MYLPPVLSTWTLEDFIVGDGFGWREYGAYDRQWGLDGALTHSRAEQEVKELAPRTAPTLATAISDARVLPLAELLESATAGSFDEVFRGTAPQGKAHRQALVMPAGGTTGSIEYDLAGADWQRLTGILGIDSRLDAAPERRGVVAVTLAVLGDGKELYRSPVLVDGGAPLPLDVSIAGVRMLKLQVTLAGEDALHAVWLEEAKLQR